MFVEDGASSFAEAIRSSRATIESKFSKIRVMVIPNPSRKNYIFI